MFYLIQCVMTFGSFLTCAIQSSTIDSVGVRRTSILTALTSSIFFTRLAVFFCASSPQLPTPAASRRSAYSDPIPLILKRSAWLVHSSKSFLSMPVLAAISFLPFADPHFSRRISTLVMPTEESHSAIAGLIPSISVIFLPCSHPSPTTSSFFRGTIRVHSPCTIHSESLECDLRRIINYLDG